MFAEHLKEVNPKLFYMYQIVEQFNVFNTGTKSHCFVPELMTQNLISLNTFYCRINCT